MSVILQASEYLRKICYVPKMNHVCNMVKHSKSTCLFEWPKEVVYPFVEMFSMILLNIDSCKNRPFWSCWFKSQITTEVLQITTDRDNVVCENNKRKLDFCTVINK